MTSHSLTGNHSAPVSAGASPMTWRTLVSIAVNSDTTTRAAIHSAVLRAGLAVAFIPHGLQKTIGAFGGYGWSGTMGFFTEQMGLPTPVAAAVILTEILGPLLLIAGLAVRPVALALIGLMLGAISMVHGANGFFMNWFGNQAGEGFEYHLLVIVLGAALAVSGAGRWSLDHMLGRRLSPQQH